MFLQLNAAIQNVGEMNVQRIAKKHRCAYDLLAISFFIFYAHGMVFSVVNI